MSTYFNSSAAPGPSHLLTVTGVWKKKSDQIPAPSDVFEVIARVETPPPGFTPPTLARFDQCNPHISLDNAFTAPPPYAPYDYEVKEEAIVSFVEEPLTLARMLFMYGFFFFPFWLAGIYILSSPLLPTPDWEAGKTEDEKIHLLRILRETELKWARRCCYAMVGLLVTTIIFFFTIKYGIMGSI